MDRHRRASSKVYLKMTGRSGDPEYPSQHGSLVIAGADDPGDRPVGSHLLDEAATNDVDVIGVDQI
jgi:hypothetical protein